LISITGLSDAALDSLLEDLERGNWIHRVLHNGSFQYQAKHEALQALLSPSQRKSFDLLLKFIDETYRSGRHLRARYLLESFLSQWETETKALVREQKIELFRVASLIFVETGDLEKAQVFCEKFLQIPELPAPEKGRILYRLGWIEYRRGNYSEALKIFDRSAKEWEKTKDPSGMAAVANFQATAHQALNDYETAKNFYRKALSLLKEEDPWRGLIRTNLAACLQEMGDFEGAMNEYEKAREESEGGSDTFLKARVSNTLSNLYLFLGQLAEAKRNAQSSLRFSLESGLSQLEGQNYLLLSVIADKEGNLQETRENIDKAVAIFGEHGTAGEKARAKLHEAYYWFTEGEDSKVLEILSEIRASFPEEKPILAQSDLLAGSVAARREDANIETGLEPLKRALKFYEGKRIRRVFLMFIPPLGNCNEKRTPERREFAIKAP
jgi:tetratricopeptide (TPR) repeat protein